MKTGAIVVGLLVLLIAFLSFIVGRRPGTTTSPTSTSAGSAKLVFKGDAAGFTGGEPVYFRGVQVGQASKPVIEGNFAVVRLTFNSTVPNGLPPCTEFETQSADPSQVAEPALTDGASTGVGFGHGVQAEHFRDDWAGVFGERVLGLVCLGPAGTSAAFQLLNNNSRP